jgi:N-acetylglutamate synthase-like GNAT family acetyltransferase
MEHTSPIIKAAESKDIDLLASIISRAYKDVAQQFSMTKENCPKHPSHCTSYWVQKDIERGVDYFLLISDGQAVGCAAIEYAEVDKAYLERLAVLPESRHKGYGRRLVNHVIHLSHPPEISKIGIGIIFEQKRLLAWYQTIGFELTGTKTFEHLPFTVGFMEFNL